MTTKREWRDRAKRAEEALTELRLPPLLTYDNLTVCFSDRTVTLRGRVISVDANCVTFPLTNDRHLLAPAGWYSIAPSDTE